MKFDEVNLKSDKYYLDVYVLDHYEEYMMRAHHGRAPRKSLCKMIAKEYFHAARAIYYSHLGHSMDEIAKEQGDFSFRKIRKLAKLMGADFMPNIDAENLTNKDAVILLLRLFGYFRPKKDIF